MLLKLQKYDLRVKYKKGSHMFLADTLSRAFLTEVHSCQSDLEDIDHTRSLSITDERLQQFEHVSRDDPVLQELHKIIARGWPENKSEIAEFLHAYYDFRDELTIQDGLVFRGSRLVVPVPLRKEMMAAAHATHIGVEGCIRRVRDVMYWPRMTTELKEYISKCDICLAHRAAPSAPSKEPLQQHPIVARPWSKVGADLCDLQGRTLLVVCDYFSNFIEVENIPKANTQGVSKALKVLFSRYGIPDELITDNGPQFSSEEFSTFARGWGFKHVTSSPRYPQSNGKAENAVKTVKRLFTKCNAARESEYLALLDWLKPRYSTEEDARALGGQKERQRYYYNRQAKALPPLAPGESVRMRLPGEKTWSPGVCTRLAGPRSYEVTVGGRTFRRNWRQLIRTNEDLQDMSGADPLTQFAGEAPVPTPQSSFPVTSDENDSLLTHEQATGSRPKHCKNQMWWNLAGRSALTNPQRGSLIMCHPDCL